MDTHKTTALELVGPACPLDAKDERELRLVLGFPSLLDSLDTYTVRHLGAPDFEGFRGMPDVRYALSVIAASHHASDGQAAAAAFCAKFVGALCGGFDFFDAMARWDKAHKRAALAIIDYMTSKGG